MFQCCEMSLILPAQIFISDTQAGDLKKQSQKFLFVALTCQVPFIKYHETVNKTVNKRGLTWLTLSE